jgi:hypothetical protein
MTYTPTGHPLAILLLLDDEGAQFTPYISRRVGIHTTNVRKALIPCMRHDLVGSEFRVSDGCRATLWHLTPKGSRVAGELRAKAQGVAA